MKSFCRSLVYLLFIPVFQAVGQTDVNEVIAGIVEQVMPVELTKVTYNQKIEQLPNESVGTMLLSITTETAKGKTESLSYKFNLADVDPHTVVRRADKKKVSVNLGINNDQPFIKVIQNGETVKYISSIQIVVSDAEQGKSLAYRFQRAISKLPRAELQWTSLADAIGWLDDFNSGFGLGETTYQENFEVDTDHNHKITLTINSSQPGEPDQENIFEFFPHHLDSRFLSLEAKGQEMDVIIPIKRKDRFIKHTLNGDLQSFDNRISLPAEELDLARQIIKTLEYIAENHSPEEVIWTDLDGALDWIKNSIGETELRSRIVTITVQEHKRDQEIEFDPSNFYRSKVNIFLQNEKGESEQLIEEFYPWQMNSKAIQLKVEGNRLFLALPVVKGRRFVKIFKNGLQQSYQPETEIYFDDVYTAEKAMSAFQFIIPATVPPPLVLETIEDANAILGDMLADYSDGRSSIRSELFFEPASYKFTYHVFETNKNGEDNEIRTEFFLDDIRGKGIEIGIDTYKMFVPIQIKDDNKYVWSKENDSQKNFSAATKIRFDDSKKAQDFITILEYLKEHPLNEYEWKDQSEVTKYISDNIGKHTLPKERLDQQWKFDAQDECSITYRVESAKEKNFTEEVFEFSLADIDSKSMKIEVTLKKMFVVLGVSGEEELIKSYKNGELQNYQGKMQFLVDDAHEGRMVMDGLKYLQDFCRQ